MSSFEYWSGLEAAMDLDQVLIQAVVVFVFVGSLHALMLYADERDKAIGSRSLTVSDLRRFSSLSLVEKMFACLVVTLAATIALGIVVTVAIMIR